MKCDTAQQNMILAGYGELHDEQMDGLEEHLAQCADCRQEFEAHEASLKRRWPSIRCWSPRRICWRRLG